LIVPGLLLALPTAGRTYLGAIHNVLQNFVTGCSRSLSSLIEIIHCDIALISMVVIGFATATA